MAGVIVVLLILMWGVLLVPMWLRRHDEAGELGSVDRFSTAMRSLSREAAAAGPSRGVIRPRAVTPRRSAGATATATVATLVASWRARRAQVEARTAVPAAPAAPAAPGAPAASRPPLTASRARLLQRRRRVMVVLAAATVLLGSGWLAGAVPGAAPLATVLLLAAYVVHLRREAVRAAQRRARAAGAAARVATAVAAPMARPSSPATAPAPVAVPVADVAAPEPLEQPEPAPVAGEEWAPVPTTLPTYVTAPVARRPAVRLLDDDAGLSVFAADDDEVELLVRRRAVNG